MKAFLASIVVLVAITFGANYALTGMEWTAADAYSTENVRLD